MTTYAVDKTSVKMAEMYCELEKQVAEQRGGFTLFGLFEVEDVGGRWDLVAAAPWLKSGSSGIGELIHALDAVSEDHSWKMLISGVVPMKEDSDFVEAITRRYRLEHALEEIGNVYVNGVYISHAFLITSKPLAASVAAELVAA